MARRANATASPLRGSLRWFNINIMLRTVFDHLCGGATPVFVAFALALGMEETSVGRVTLAASLGCGFQMIVLPVLGRVQDRKRFVVTVGTLEPLVLIGMLLLAPLLPREHRSWAIVAAVFLAAACLHMTRPAIDDWVASTIPGGLRGRYIGGRGRLVALILATLAITGPITDLVGRNNALGIGLLLATGAAFGLASVVAISRASMLPMSPATGLRLTDVPRVFAHAPFRRYAIGSIFYFVPFLLAMPYYQVLYQKVLVMSFTQIAVFGVMYQVVKLVLMGKASRLVERFGPRAMILAIGPLYVTFFSLLACATPERTWPVFVGWTLVGVGDAVFLVASQSTLYASVPQGGSRPAYFAVSNLLTVGIFAIGAAAGELLAKQLGPLAGTTFGPLTLTEYHWMYVISAALMIPGTLGGLFYAGKEAMRREVAARAEAVEKELESAAAV